MFIVVDASMWVARLVSEDIFYQPVKDWMSARLEREDQFLAPSPLLAEIGGAISRRTTPSLGLKAVEQLQSLPGLQLVEMEQELHKRQLNWRLNSACVGRIPLMWRSRHGLVSL
jgi:hypothetical protein